MGLRAVRDGYSSVVGNTVDFAPQPLGSHINPTGVAGYCCDLRHKARETVERLSIEGETSPYAWSIPIAQAALGFWEQRFDGAPVEDDFLDLANWFIDRAEETPTGTVWRSPFAVPKYGLERGWISAMGQSQAISVLLRAAQLTGDKGYGQMAQAALGPLQTPVAAGGTQRDVGGALVLEEYPTATPAMVLNGWIFALWGVHELAVAHASRPAHELFERSSASLIASLPRYDLGWWTLYSLYDHGRPDLAKPFYQELHPVLLEALDLVRPDPRLRDYADRWRAQRTRWHTARASFNKLHFRAYRAFR